MPSTLVRSRNNKSESPNESEGRCAVLKIQTRSSSGSGSTHTRVKMTHGKYFILIPGRTFASQEDSIKNSIEQWSGLQTVSSVNECDVILVFCPIVSRAGTNIDSAVKELNTLSESKPAVFMVGHHTFDPEKTLIDSSKFVTRENTFTVDCLFNEDVFLNFERNKQALEKIEHWLNKKEENISSQGCIDKISVSSELILILLGNSQFEKVAVKNMIFGREDSQDDSSPVTQITMDSAAVDEAKVVLFNTPGDLSKEKLQKEIRFLVSLISQKPYALLLVNPDKQTTEEEIKFVKNFQDMLMIIYTVPDKQSTVQMHSGKEFNNPNHVLNISKRENRDQVSELMKKIEKMLAGDLKSLTDYQKKAAVIKSEQVLIGEARNYIKTTQENCTLWISPEPSDPFVMECENVEIPHYDNTCCRQDN